MKRVLLKLSGEALNAPGQFGLGEYEISTMVSQMLIAAQQGVEVAVVIGGGNFLRGAQACGNQLKRITADHMGILATVLNGLALRDAITAKGYSVLLYSALPIPGIVEGVNIRHAQEALSRGTIVIFAGGTGNPFVTTDSAASLRAVEIEADVLLKATKVDGIYDKDPAKHKDAKRFDHLTFDEVLTRRLEVMDIGAFSQCKEHHIPIRIFNLFKPDALEKALLGSNEGSLISD